MTHIHSKDNKNNEISGDVLEPWIAYIEEYQAKFREYLDEVQDVIEKSRSATGKRVWQAIQESDDVMSAVKSISKSSELQTQGANVFKVLGMLSHTRDILDLALQAVIAAKINTLVADRQMSKTSIERTTRMYAELRVSSTNVSGAQWKGTQLVIDAWAPTLSNFDTEYIHTSFEEAPATNVSAELYASILSTWKRNDRPKWSQYVSQTEQKILNLPIDTIETITAATTARSKMHPIQAMGVTFGMYVGNTVPRDTVMQDDAIDLTLPQAVRAVEYLSDQLISREGAEKFGPIATTSAGLNYNLVQRMDTMRERLIDTKLKVSSEHSINKALPLSHLLVAGTKVGDTKYKLRTIDRGNSFQQLKGTSSNMNLTAGPALRIEQLGTLLEEAVKLSGGNVDTDLILNQFRTSNQTAQSKEYSITELQNTLMSNFKRLLDIRAPNDAESMRSLVLGGDSSDIMDSYIADTISTTHHRTVERTIARQTGGKSILHPTEIYLTAQVRVRESALAMRKALADAYEIEGILGLTRAIYEELKDSRAAHLALLRSYERVVRVALGVGTDSSLPQSVEKQATIIPTPSLKQYFLQY
jgi:hypothetical protein